MGCGVQALQAAQVQLELADSDRAALAARAGRLEAELAGSQCRLHDALEVLEGVLGERSALLRHTRELQEQLAAALEERRCSRREAGSAGGSPAAATPRQQLRQELALAQVRGGGLQTSLVICSSWLCRRSCITLLHMAVL